MRFRARSAAGHHGRVTSGRPRTRNRTARPAPAPAPRKHPTNARAEVTYAAILTAVERVLEREGVPGLNTNRIAEIAGVSVGTLYQYFPNKEALVGALLDRYTGQYLAVFRMVLAGGRDIPIAQLARHLGAGILAAFRSQGPSPVHRALYELRSAAAFHDRFARTMDAYASELEAFLRARDDVEVDDPAAAAFVLVHSIEGVVNASANRADRIALEPVLAQAVALVERFLVPGAGRS